jgi:hypothetical protein
MSLHFRDGDREQTQAASLEVGNAYPHNVISAPLRRVGNGLQGFAGMVEASFPKHGHTVLVRTTGTESRSGYWHGQRSVEIGLRYEPEEELAIINGLVLRLHAH